jgi:hypothetical protein
MESEDMDEYFTPAPALNGANFREAVNTYAEELQAQGLITNVRKNISYNDQFYAPVSFLVGNTEIVLFSTTSVRSDRIKTHQWDAWGIKNNLKKDMRCVLVLPDNLSAKESSNADKENDRLTRPGYMTMLDAILQLSGVKTYIETFKN